MKLQPIRDVVILVLTEYLTHCSPVAQWISHNLGHISSGTHIDQIHKSHNAPVPYPTMHHSEQKCADFCTEWCIGGYGTGVLWDWFNNFVSQHQAIEKLITWTSVELSLIRGVFQKAYKLLNLRALKFSPTNKVHIFQCMGKLFCVEFQRTPLKFQRLKIQSVMW